MAWWLTLLWTVLQLVLYAIVVVLCIKFWNRLTLGKCTSKCSMRGKTVIITGGNGGIGKEAAKELARREARVILACRNLSKAQAAADEILQETGMPVVVKKLDLCSFRSVREFAKDILQTESRLDVLINNAGITGNKKVQMTDDGLEETYQANHFGHFLLTNLLLDLLKQSAPSRIINVASLGYIFGKVDPETLLKTQEDVKLSAFRYFDTKLANILFTIELASNLHGTGVTANTLHPGVVRTDIAKKSICLSNLLLDLNMFVFGRTAKEGSETIVHLAVADEVAKVTGRYFTECEVTWTARKARDVKTAKKLWEVSEIATRPKLCSSCASKIEAES